MMYLGCVKIYDGKEPIIENGKYKEVENISKQISKELKHYNLKNKVSYKKFLNE